MNILIKLQKHINKTIEKLLYHEFSLLYESHHLNPKSDIPVIRRKTNQLALNYLMFE